MRQVNSEPLWFFGQITEHFTWREILKSETAARHGLSNIPTDPAHVENIIYTCRQMEIVRAAFLGVIDVTSCYRAPAVNALVPGSSPTSAHPSGLAMDFEVRGVDNLVVCQRLPEILKDWDQIIFEFGPDGWVHLGFSRGPGRRQILTAYHGPGKKTKYVPGLHPEYFKQAA